MVEFALVLPIFLVLLVGIIEFVFILNAALGLNFATRNASLAAAEAGNSLGADCAILTAVQHSIGAPMDIQQVQTVAIYKTDRGGAPVVPAVQDVWTRVASQNNYDANCVSSGSPGYTGTAVYTLYFQPSATGWATSGSETSPGRCDVLQGCCTIAAAAGGCPNPPTGFISLDSIGVNIDYHYPYHTPLGNFLALPGWSHGYIDLGSSNVNRMEPTL
ncbi:MAG: TadE/TadG family type IV pilus assembly protein [Candidatus Limnocylindrales bacterium]